MLDNSKKYRLTKSQIEALRISAVPSIIYDKETNVVYGSNRNSLENSWIRVISARRLVKLGLLNNMYQVSFLTVWFYEFDYDEWNHEYDESYGIVGQANYQDLLSDALDHLQVRRN